MATVEVIKAKGPVKYSDGVKIEKKRVAAYCRVSTEDADQKKSYDSQCAYYEETIKKNKDWQFVGIYADEAITGTSVDKRKNFQRMISDCVDGKVDVILTKSISRFARNTIDTLTYVRLLKEHKVEVVFEDENIHTLSMEGEMLLTVLSSVYQQEVENISANVKKGLKMRAMRGELVSFNGCLGYDYIRETKQIVVNPEEAKVVKFIFKKYLEGYGTGMIAKMLTKKGYRTKRGVVIWSDSTVLGILKNEKYVGDVLIGKTFTADPITKRRLKNLGDEEMVLISDHHEAIIKREDFEKAKQIRESRNSHRNGYHGEVPAERESRYSSKYAFSGKIICGFCGSVYRRRSQTGTYMEPKVVWACGNQKHKGRTNCPEAKTITESALENAFVTAYNEIFKNNPEMIKTFLSNVEEALSEDESDTSIETITNRIKDIAKKKEKLLDARLSDLISTEEFKKKNERLTQREESLKNTLEHLENESEVNDKLQDKIEKFRCRLECGLDITEFDRRLFETLVDHIEIGGYNEDGEVDNDIIKIIFTTVPDPSGRNTSSNSFEVARFDMYEPHYIFKCEDDGSRKKIVKDAYCISARIAV